MNQPSPNPSQVVGVVPWLPWPLSAWSWWTEPVRAERLAALRIGLALCLIADIAYHYAPETFAYFGKRGDDDSGHLGEPAIFAWRFYAPRMNWSLLRGVGDGALQHLSLAIWFVLTGWILGNGFVRLLWAERNPPRDDRSGAATTIWTLAFAWYVLSLWSPMIAAKKIDFLAWVVPLVGCSLVFLFCVLDLAVRLRDESYRLGWLSLLFALVVSTSLFGGGLVLARMDDIDPSAEWVRYLKPWQEDDILLQAAMVLWLSAAVLLLVGCFTRFAAVLTWLMSISFANANPYLDNAGDTIRLILLFYLMLCPCGAACSIDALFRRLPGPVFVSPWAIRLIFVQMIFIYWMNGLYKLFGDSWLNGTSLHYVLGDLALTRFSQVGVPIPFEITRMMTWSVLIWEVTFPIMVLFKWTRRIALFFGVIFHLGIFASMELGGFVPYALCMYLPLAPWEWLRRGEK